MLLRPSLRYEKTNSLEILNNIRFSSVFQKVSRLLYSELSHIIRRQSPVKIELLAFVLCDIPLEALEHADISDIKNILCSCEDTQIDESFQAKARYSLSQECALCGESFPRSRIEAMYLCPHACCTNCIKEYYRTAIPNIRNAEALSTLTCFERHDLPADNDERMGFFQFLGSKVSSVAYSSKSMFEEMHRLSS